MPKVDRLVFSRSTHRGPSPSPHQQQQQQRRQQQYSRSRIERIYASSYDHCADSRYSLAFLLLLSYYSTYTDTQTSERSRARQSTTMASSIDRFAFDLLLFFGRLLQAACGAMQDRVLERVWHEPTVHGSAVTTTITRRRCRCVMDAWSNAKEHADDSLSSERLTIFDCLTIERFD